MSQARKREVPARSKIVAFKLVGQLVGAIENAEGDIVGERVIGDVAVYAPDFGRIGEMIDEQVEAHREELEADL